MEQCTATFGLSRDNWGKLTLIDSDGRRHCNVRAARMFPISDPDRWIVIKDSEGAKLFPWMNWEAYRKLRRALIIEDLDDREFMPRISEIISIGRIGDHLDWVAKTNRGIANFRLPSCESMRIMGTGEMILTDENGIRYLISDISEMPYACRRKIEKCMY